jgi:hypothetical protein
VSSAQGPGPALELPHAYIAFVREELSDLRDAGLLGPWELEWAIEYLVSGGVGLPDVLSVVFDYGELNWLAEMTARLDVATEDEALLALANQLGLDPATGKRVTPAPSQRPLHESFPPEVLARRDAGAHGSEGVRERPLRGWRT